MDSRNVEKSFQVAKFAGPDIYGTADPEAEYVAFLEKDIRAAEKAAAIDEAVRKFERQCREFEDDLKTTCYHPYSDPDGFVYCIMLVRVFLLENRVEKLALKLYESDCFPHGYAAYIKNPLPDDAHSGGIRWTWRDRTVLASPGSSWEEAFGCFREFFRAKTGIEWEDRLEPQPASEEEEDPEAGEGFRYDPPKTGPRGLVRGRTMAEMYAKEMREREAIEHRIRAFNQDSKDSA